MANAYYQARSGRWAALNGSGSIVPPEPPAAGPPPPAPTPGGSGMLLGASRDPGSAGTTAWRTLEAQAGPYSAARAFNVGGFEKDFASSIMADDVGVCVSMPSWKPDLNSMAAGVYDEQIRTIFLGAPTSHPILATIWHEPDVKTRKKASTSSGPFTPALFLPAIRRFCSVVNELALPHVYCGITLANYSLITPGLTTGLADDFWPGEGYIRWVGFDTYMVSNTSAGGSHELGACVTWAKAKNLDFTIPELGLDADVTDQAAANAWINDVLAYAHSHTTGGHAGCAAVTFFNDGVPKYPSDESAYIANSRTQAELYQTSYASWVL